MIKTTLGELIEAEQALARVVTKEGFSFKTVYALTKMSRLVREETKIWWEQRNKLFERFGIERDSTPAEKPIHGPKVREITADNSTEFLSLLKELNATEVKIEWNPIKSTDLPGITAGDILILGPLCELVEPKDDSN